MLAVDAIGSFSALGLEGLDRIPGLFQRAGHEPANRPRFPAHLVRDLRQGGTVLALEQGDHLGLLAALSRPGGFLLLGGLFGLGRVFGGGGLLGRLGLGRRALGGLCATLGLLVE